MYQFIWIIRLFFRFLMQLLIVIILHCMPSVIILAN